MNIRQRQVEEVFGGGIVLFSWHARNPVTGRNYMDKSGQGFHAILPGGACPDRWRKKLDDIAESVDALEVDGLIAKLGCENGRLSPPTSHDLGFAEFELGSLPILAKSGHDCLNDKVRPRNRICQGGANASGGYNLTD